jgi:hypothetical protein
VHTCQLESPLQHRRYSVHDVTPQENAAQLRELGVVPAVLETLRMHCYGAGSEVPATLARTLNNIFKQ